MGEGDGTPVGPGDNSATPREPCALTTPWKLVHRAEADAGGMDRFASDTCVELDGKATLFIPRELIYDDVNRVHVCFTANDVSGDDFNAVTSHALRAAADRAGWILIAFAHKSASDAITAAQIVELLERHGRGKRIDQLRLSSHSRGCYNLTNSVKSGELVAVGASPPVVDMTMLDRVVSFDSDAPASGVVGTAGLFWPLVVAAGVPAEIVYGYQATIPIPVWSIPPERTLDLSWDIVKKGLCALGYLRLVNDAPIVRPDVVIPPAIATAAATLPIQPLGGYRTWAAWGDVNPFPSVPAFVSLFGPAPEQLGLGEFCLTKIGEIDALVGSDFTVAGPCELNKFVKANKLARLGPPVDFMYSPPTMHHHLFVAEFVHEVTDIHPPALSLWP